MLKVCSLIAASCLLTSTPAGAGGDYSFPARPVRVDCTPLNPPSQASAEVKAKGEAGANILIKQLANANAGAEVYAKYSSDIKNMPNADQILIKQIEAFTICLAMQANPDQAGSLARVLLSKSIPDAGKRKVQDDVVSAPKFPTSGTVTLSSRSANLFNEGAIEIQSNVEQSKSGGVDTAYLKRMKLTPEEASIVVRLNVVSNALNGKSEVYDAAFYLRESHSFIIGKQRFSMTLVRIYDATGDADFQVRPLK